EDLILGGEVVVDESVRDPRLIGDVGDPAGVKSLAREHAHGGIEDHPPLVDGGGLGRSHSYVLPAPYTPGRPFARAGSGRRRARGLAGSAAATLAHSRSGAAASTSPHGSTVSERPPERCGGRAPSSPI